MQGSIIVKVADTQQALTSASQDHQRGQILVQMATARDLDQDATAASEDYTKVATASLIYKYLMSS